MTCWSEGLSEYRRQIVVGGVVALTIGIIVLASVVYLPLGNTSTSTPATTTASTTTSTTISQSNPASMTRAQTTNSTLGLKLQLSINSTTYYIGEYISVNITESNTLATSNNVSASSHWPVAGLSIGQCGTVGSPVGVAVFQGYYTTSNVSSVEHLQIFEPGTYFCPGSSQNIVSYRFQPSSDSALVCSEYPSSCQNLPNASYEISASGYWFKASSNNSSQSVFTYFGPGTYTVVGGDEWGDVVILHFAVTGQSTSLSTGSISTLSITANINGSTIDTFGSALRITVTVHNNGTSTISIPFLYRIVQGADVLNSAGTDIGGTGITSGLSQTNSAGQIIPQTVSLSAGASLIANLTIVFLTSQNQTTPNLPVSVEGPTSMNVYGAAYIQDNQSYTIRVNAFYPDGKAATFSFPLFSPISVPCTTTFQTGLNGPSFLKFGLKQSASLQVCVIYYYYNDSAADTINFNNWQQLIAISSQLKNGSINSSGNFTVASSVGSATLGGSHNMGEGTSVVYTITPKVYGNWTYGFSFGWLYPSMQACGQDFLLSTGGGSSYPFTGCTASLPYTLNSEGFVSGFLFAEIVGVSNSTQ